MRKNVNKVTLEGRVYGFGDNNGKNMLEVRTSGPESKVPGTVFIKGVLQVAIDDAGINVIPVYYTYVTEKTKNGGNNSTFAALKKILDNGVTWSSHGPDAAPKVKIDTSIKLNEFYTEENGEEKLVSTKVCEGGFLTFVDHLEPDIEKRNSFVADMIITRATRVEADPENHIPEDFVRINGAIFDFRNALLPVDFIVRNPNGMSYFESAGVEDEPLYTKVTGSIFYKNEVEAVTEESAFGGPIVSNRPKRSKEWLVNSAAKMPYEFGEEGVLTADELKEAMQARNVYLAEMKAKQEEYRARAASTTTPIQPPVKKAAAGGFNF